MMRSQALVCRAVYTGARHAATCAVAAVGLLSAACDPSHNSEPAPTTAIDNIDATTLGLVPGGPAAQQTIAPGAPAAFGDSLIQSDLLNVLVGSAARGQSASAAVRQTAGALLDLAVNGAVNDQLTLFTQSVLGLKLTGIADPPAAPNNPADNPVLWTSVGVVDIGDGSSAIRCSGVILETSTSTPGTGTFIGAEIRVDVPGLTGLPVVVGAASDQPLSIQTTYSVRGGDRFLRIDSTVTCGAGDTINIFSIADLLVKELSDALGTDPELNPFNPISGPQELGLTQQVVVPYVNHFNTFLTGGVTQTSYTHFDPFFGLMIHASTAEAEEDGGATPVSLMAEVPQAGAAGTVLTAAVPQLWTRFLSVGAVGDVASSANVAIERIAASEALRGRGPNSIGAAGTISGTVTGPAGSLLGAQVLIIQNNPALVFNPLAAGGPEYQPSPVPDPVLQTTPPSGPGVLVVSAGAIAADATFSTGTFSVTVPVDFDGRVPVSFMGAGLEGVPGTTCTYYAVVVNPAAGFATIDTTPDAAVVQTGDVVNFTVDP